MGSTKEKKIPLLYRELQDCCGCTACAAVCPRHAISFQENNRGFFYPIVNEEKCVGCLKCEEVCSYKLDIQKNNYDKDELIAVYAVKSNNQEVIGKSSSGGVFTALSDYFIESDNAIASCVYNDKLYAVELIIYNDKITRDSARGSKYIQAEIKDGFSKIIDWLKKHPDKKLLVIGTGCQIAGLNKLLEEKKIREQAVLVDLICHGAPSPGLWKKYANSLEKKIGAHIETISFKDKKYGWKNPGTYANMGDKEISIKPFADWFYAEWSIRESCYQCPYTKLSRLSDITIGDYWGIENVEPEFYDSMGVSLVLIQSEMGNNIFESIKDKIVYVESNSKDCLQPRLISAANRPKNSEKFWRDIEKKGFEYCTKKYKEEDVKSLLYRTKRKFKRLFGM